MRRTGTTRCIPITDPTCVGEARRVAQRLFQEAGGDAAASARVGIVVTEAASNLFKHAREGRLFVTAHEDAPQALELIAVDQGPGMADVDRCLNDGFSTTGTAGTGLGAIRRIADAFDLHSVPGRGSILFLRVGESPPTPAPWRVGALSVPAKGETECGDAWCVRAEPDLLRVLVTDGLGHGPLAAAASQAAVRVFSESDLRADLVGLTQDLHRALRGTRGAALAIADIVPSEGRVRFAGVGNISASLLTPGASRGLMSHAGIVGHEMRNVQVIDVPWAPNATLLLHSDGLTSRWSLEPFPGLLGRHPALVAATIFRESLRGRDDATIVAVTHTQT